MSKKAPTTLKVGKVSLKRTNLTVQKTTKKSKQQKQAKDDQKDIESEGKAGEDFMNPDQNTNAIQLT